MDFIYFYLKITTRNYMSSNWISSNFCQLRYCGDASDFCQYRYCGESQRVLFEGPQGGQLCKVHYTKYQKRAKLSPKLANEEFAPILQNVIEANKNYKLMQQAKDEAKIARSKGFCQSCGTQKLRFYQLPNHLLVCQREYKNYWKARQTKANAEEKFHQNFTFNAKTRRIAAILPDGTLSEQLKLPNAKSSVAKSQGTLISAQPPPQARDNFTTSDTCSGSRKRLRSNDSQDREWVWESYNPESAETQQSDTSGEWEWVQIALESPSNAPNGHDAIVEPETQRDMPFYVPMPSQNYLLGQNEGCLPYSHQPVSGTQNSFPCPPQCTPVVILPEISLKEESPNLTIVLEKSWETISTPQYLDYPLVFDLFALDKDDRYWDFENRD